MRSPLGAWALAVLLVSAVSCAGAPSTERIGTVAFFDPAAFEGTWYEVARIPIPVARDWVATSDTYRLQSDGTWSVVYAGLQGGFGGPPGTMTQVLKHREGLGPGEFLASPLPLVWLPYRLVSWDREDRILLVTSSTYDSLWIMARDPVPVPEAYQRAVDRARDLGFDVGRLETVPQKAP